MISKILITVYTRLLKSAYRRGRHYGLRDSNNNIGTTRFEVLWRDERWNDTFGLINSRPWYLPFNIFIHRWFRSDSGLMHDHPRWTITIVLTGHFIEELPKKRRWLSPGSVVFRSHNSVHKIIIPKGQKVRTVFITGRRRWRQHYYNGEIKRPATKFDAPPTEEPKQ